MSGQHGLHQSGHQSNPPADTSRRPTASPTASAFPSPAWPAMAGPPGRRTPLPPLIPGSAIPADSSERQLTRSLGVHSILNPQPGASTEPRGRRRSYGQMESPSPLQTQPPSFPSLSRPSSLESLGEDLMPPAALESRSGPRPMISPRSPTVHRAQSMGFLRPATGTINAQQTPFLSPSTRMPGPEQNLPTEQPQPVLSAAGRQSYPGQQPVPTPPLHPLRVRRGSGQVAPSASASPATSYSGYSMDFPQITSGEAPPISTSGTPFSTEVSRSGTSRPQGTFESSRSFGNIPVASTGHNTYEMITLETGQGHVQIPVDVQAASRVADEKRRRNAGASARFRARRKQKEQEANQTIDRLNRQLRYAHDDAAFYRSERDFFAQLVYRSNGGQQHFPRPQSPRHRRTSIPESSIGAPSSGSGSPSGGYSEISERTQAPDSGRNVRRRTSTYIPPSNPAESPRQGSFGGYPPITPAPPGHTHPGSGPGRPHVPHSTSQQQLQQQVPQSPFQPSRRPDQRSWPPPPDQGPR